MTIRPAAAADVAPVTALERDCFGPDAWSAAAVAEELTGPRRHAVVAEDDSGGLAGYAVAAVAGEVADLQRVAVAPAHRRAGTARALLRALREWAGRQAAERMLLEVAASNAPALGLYRSEGFVPIDRRPAYYRDGSDALVLALPLTAADGAAAGGKVR